ncbi:MAG: VWA domain-containing protein [Ignavibacteria bacterium]|nr:VWA domain-containing protein [Ignavibacteria bacterium]
MRTFRLMFVATAALLFAAASLQAQTNVRVTSLKSQVGTPEAHTTFRVLCDGQPYYDLRPSLFTLTDNGKAVNDISIVTYASPLTRNPFTAMLVLDVSGSMAGAGIAGLKVASNALVDFLNPQDDEAGIISFSSTVTLRRNFTSDKSRLHATVDSLNATGATAVWDAACAGIQLLAAHQGKQSQAVVVMTDGGDNMSSKTPQDVALFALQHNKRVFTIALGTGPQTQHLQYIADTTGGLFFQTPSPNDLASIFLQIASFARRGFDEYTVRYTSPDPLAAEHTLGVAVTVCDTMAFGSVTRKSLNALAVGGAERPSSAVLLRNYPNPLARSTVIEYTLPQGEHDVTLDLLDVSGRVVATVLRVRQQGGAHSADFDAGSLPAGVYLVRLRAGESVATTRMIVTK